MFGFFKKISKPKDIEEVKPEDVIIEPEEIEIDLSDVKVNTKSFDDVYADNLQPRIMEEVKKSIQNILMNGPKYHHTKSLMESGQISKYNLDRDAYNEALERFPGAKVYLLPTEPGCNKLMTDIDDPDYLLEILARKQVEEFYSDK